MKKQDPLNQVIDEITAQARWLANLLAYLFLAVALGGGIVAIVIAISRWPK